MASHTLGTTRQRSVPLPDGTILSYTLTRKSVKNINLRIHTDGTVAVSANTRVSLGRIDAFILSRADWIVANQARLATRPQTGQKGDAPGDAACRPVFTAVLDRYYPWFKARGVPYPTLKIKAMTSRWGSCTPAKGVVTLNAWLLTKPMAALEYVVVHELAHFLVQNHSPAFHAVVAEVLPDHKSRRKLLK